MTLIPALQGHSVFAVACRLHESRIYPGIAFIKEDANLGKLVRLVNNLDPSQEFFVELPDQPGIWTRAVDGNFSFPFIRSNP